MNRRGFIKGAALAVAAAPAAASASVIKPNGIRMSTDKADPGYRAWCIAMGDGKKPKVFLNGVEQKHCSMADESLGEVKRAVLTPSGNLAIGRDEILEEIVYGDVKILVD
ncbi:twin-arginine translocation signal domain-containing protein [Rhizobium sp. Root651]|uniref:twin-arginine translocation signal domain-containing protein n=1 Tax=Rhizobium sp. Root651 TaxID=1736577 RepID=UPI000714A25D|nr:twin-arginine translocation signal domain-containing protein [Rhizobium sp. Root651]KRA63119.1 hypothetical protein ASD85_06625 [Rhizobium sp. Root651]